jgi:hypothetical protein
MNDQSSDNQAWVWYEPETLVLRHVGFNETAWQDSHLEKLEVAFQTALDIASGKSRLFEYRLDKLDAGLQFVYIKKSKPFSKFWQLVEPSRDIASARFDDTSSTSSPILIKDKTDDSITVDVISKAKNIELYITMKNDPNYLIDKINLFPYAATAVSTTDIKIPISVNGEYSIYVRYDAS